MSQQLVNLVIFAPVFFAALVLLFPSSEKALIRAITLFGMLVTLGFSAYLYLQFDPAGAEFQHEFRARWSDELGISYHVGVDGLAVSLMLLTGILGPLLVLASWTYITERVKEFHIALLFLQTAMLGALGALDIVLFYIFWEAMLIPMYLLVGVWGSEERQKAAMKFFIYTLAGSLLMLVAILAVYFLAQPSGPRSFDYAAIFNALLDANRELGACTNNPDCAMGPVATALKTYGPYLFLAFALAFAIKVPMFPVHTWLPDAHVQAPAAGSMVLAGVMLKMGTFGFWRYAIPLFPAQAHEWRMALSVLAVIGIVYGALMCLAQRDIKKLIAYSSVSHLGYCMLGMLAFSAEGASGAAYQMLNHGVSTGALFLLFGLVYERRHARLMSEYGGIAKVMPVFAATFLIVTFSSVAVPGTNGFVGEFLVLLGAFKGDYPLWVPTLATTGVILGAAYMLWMAQRVFFGEVTQRENHGLTDLNLRELVTVAPLVVLIFVMGLRPQPFLDRLAQPVERFVARAQVGKNGEVTERVKMVVAPLPALENRPTRLRERQPLRLNPTGALAPALPNP